MQREFLVNRACGEIIPIIRRELDTAGFRVNQSFDLRSALALVPECTCPHHGTALCDCQYHVLLIYGQAETPATLIVHGHDRRSWITLADDPGGNVRLVLESEIIETLAIARLITQVQTDDATFPGTAS